MSAISLRENLDRLGRPIASRTAKFTRLPRVTSRNVTSNQATGGFQMISGRLAQLRTTGPERPTADRQQTVSFVIGRCPGNTISNLADFPNAVHFSQEIHCACDVKRVPCDASESRSGAIRAILFKTKRH